MNMNVLQGNTPPLLPTPQLAPNHNPPTCVFPMMYPRAAPVPVQPSRSNQMYISAQVAAHCAQVSQTPAQVFHQQQQHAFAQHLNAQQRNALLYQQYQQQQQQPQLRFQHVPASPDRNMASGFGPQHPLMKSAQTSPMARPLRPIIGQPLIAHSAVNTMADAIGLPTAARASSQLPLDKGRQSADVVAVTSEVSPLIRSSSAPIGQNSDHALVYQQTDGGGKIKSKGRMSSI